MSDQATVSQWLRELSAGSSALSLDEDGTCVLADEDGHVIRIEVPGSSGRVYLMSHLGPWRADRDGAMLEALMKANFLGLQTNGASLAIDERSNQLCLGFSEAVAHLDAQRLKGVIERFADLRLTWGTRIEEMRRREPAPAGARDVPSEVGGESAELMFIRL